jgi:small subunit ribosomal protein S4
MGDPRKKRKKYSTPMQRWNKARIEQDKKTKKDYGLRATREILKSQSILRTFTRQAKKLIGVSGKQKELEEKQLMGRLVNLGIFNAPTTLENVLNLTASDIMNRRLQTIVFKKRLALTPNQARQFIIHGHICIGDKKCNVPSHLVTREEEAKITYKGTSKIAKDNHPETSKLRKEAKKEDGKKTGERKETKKL